MDFDRQILTGPTKPLKGAQTDLRAIYCAPKTGKPFGTVVYLHPGAFKAGDADMVDGFADQICARGMAVLSLGYRLGGTSEDMRPETRDLMTRLSTPVPGRGFYGLLPRLRHASAFCAIEDVLDMLTQLTAARDLGPLVVYGDSAGGIAALTLMGIPDLSRQMPPLAGAIVLSGAAPYLVASDVLAGPPLLWLHCLHDRKVSSDSARAMQTVQGQRAQPCRIEVVRGRAHGYAMLQRNLVPGMNPDAPMSILWDFAEARMKEA